MGPLGKLPGSSPSAKTAGALPSSDAVCPSHVCAHCGMCPFRSLCQPLKQLSNLSFKSLEINGFDFTYPLFCDISPMKFRNFIIFYFGIDALAPSMANCACCLSLTDRRSMVPPILQTSNVGTNFAGRGTYITKEFYICSGTARSSIPVQQFYQNLKRSCNGIKSSNSGRPVH